MGAELIIKDVSIRDVGSNELHYLKDKLEEREENMCRIKERILMFASATPRDIVVEGGEGGEGGFVNVTLWEDHIQTEINDLLGEYASLAADCRLLYSAIEYPEDTEVSI